MEEVLLQRFWELRQEKRMVGRGWFRLAARWYFGVVYPGLPHEQFRFSNGWFLGFLSRWGISTRVTTNTAQAVPADHKEQIETWFKFNRCNSQLRSTDIITLHHSVPDEMQDIGRYRLGSIYNMDQTPLLFEYLSGRTYAMKENRTVWAKAIKSGWDK
jgi:hypothetical protein